MTRDDYVAVTLRALVFGHLSVVLRNLREVGKITDKTIIPSWHEAPLQRMEENLSCFLSHCILSWWALKRSRNYSSSIPHFIKWKTKAHCGPGAPSFLIPRLQLFPQYTITNVQTWLLRALGTSLLSCSSHPHPFLTVADLHPYPSIIGFHYNILSLNFFSDP